MIKIEYTGLYNCELDNNSVQPVWKEAALKIE